MLFSNLTLAEILIRVLVLMTALPVHECAHALVASMLGDKTAKYQGRITLNPVKHLDLIGSIGMILVGFGWAKPVQINPRNFKNPKVGMAISSLAGPVSNILLAYISLIVYKILVYSLITNSVVLTMFTAIFSEMVILNIGLAIFNLLPIPPLDGSRIATLFLPPKTYFQIMQYEQYIFIGLIIVLATHILDKPLQFLMSILFNILDNLSAFVPVLLGLVK